MTASFHHSDFPLGELLERKRESVSVVLPAREEEATIADIVAKLTGLGELVDQIVVVDGDSEDRTAEVAAEAGAEVHRESELLPQFGPVLGKGDAMWRALSVVAGDVVVYVDADTIGFPTHFVTGLLGPLLAQPELVFVKGAFERPFIGDGVVRPREGGRVTELCARPLLRAFYPPLAELAQPLAGEVAVRRTVLEEVPFATGYGIEIAMLIDVYERWGAAAMAQVDLGERRNEHQSLLALGPMSYTVLGAVLRRLRREGRLADEDLLPYRSPDGRLVEVQGVERPPFASVRGTAAPDAAR